MSKAYTEARWCAFCLLSGGWVGGAWEVQGPLAETTGSQVPRLGWAEAASQPNKADELHDRLFISCTVPSVTGLVARR